MSLRRITALFFTALVAFAPSGTRYIWRTGMIDGRAVEPGTISLFGMQAVALAFVILAFAGSGRQAIASAMKRPAAIFALLVAAAAALASLQAHDRAASLVAAGSVILGVAVFLAIILFRPQPHEVLSAFVGGAVFQFGLGAWQFLTQSAFASKWLGMASHSAEQLGTFVVETESGRWLRAYGSLSHPNVFGLYVGIGLLSCISLAAFRGHGRHLRFFALMPLIAAALFFSFSKSAILAVAAGFLWVVISAYGSEAAPTYRRVIIPSFIIIAATFAAFGLLFSEPLKARALGAGRLEAQSVAERGTQVSDAVELFTRHQLIGVGPGQMPLAVKREVDPVRSWWQYQYVHNVSLLAAVETGVIGLFSWAGFVVSILVIIGRRLKQKASGQAISDKRQATRRSSGVTAYAASFIVLLAGSLFDHFLWSSWFGQLLFWTTAGLLVAAYIGIETSVTKTPIDRIQKSG